MKKILYRILIMIPLAGAAGCNDWLLELPAGTQTLDEYYVSGETCGPVVLGCYVPMMWELGTTYFSEWMIGDVCSDDAVKGGQFAADHNSLLEMEKFHVNADNDLLLDYYRTQYIGIARCNRALADIPNVATDEYMDDLLKARYIAEAKFMRAFYHFRLARVFGKVPYVDFVIDGTDKLTLQRASLETIYAGIVRDLKDAEVFLWEKSGYPPEELGRATKGAAQAMLLKVYLTGHQYLEDAWAQAEYWGEQIYEGGGYTLCPNYWDNFTLAGENGPESVFEIQYTNDETGAYGEGNLGFTRGNFTVILQRCRSEILMGGDKGWGYNRPTQSLFDEYEAGDPRRDMTIYTLKDNEISNFSEDVYEGAQDDNGNQIKGIRRVSLKYALMDEGADGGRYHLSLDPRGPINWKEIRYADVLLMYAEACWHNGNMPKAKALLEEVRARARGANPDILPQFPGYNGYSDSDEDLLKAIRHERRVELAMEGHRWFDLNRWGITAAAMTAFAATPEIMGIYPDMGPFREGINEIFPIPSEERRLGGLDQNPGY